MPARFGRGNIMPDYAVLVYFDTASEENIRILQEEASRVSGNTYIFDNRIFPHITLSLFSKDDYQDLIEDLHVFSKRLRNIDINLTSIGIFNSTPAVVNLLPVVSKDITRIHQLLHKKLSRHECDFNPYYEEANWVPHCAVAVNISSTELMPVIETTCALFKPMVCRLSTLSLVECNPYCEVMDWNISPV